MKFDIPISSVEARTTKDTLIIKSEAPLKILSSAILNGGFIEVKAIINHHIPKNYDHRDPEVLLSKVAEELGLPVPTVGFMTAASMQNVALAVEEYKDLTVCALITAGLSNAATAGDTVDFLPDDVGTINIILLIDGNLTDGCMVETVKIVTEAKSVAVREFNVKSRFSGELASGTTTDTVVVACTGRGKPIQYAGTGTKLGEMIGKTVRRATKEAVQKQDGIKPSVP